MRPISRARINLGIRRRLAPLMENDRRKIELLNALLISMPGTPVLYYGDEIGMGDNIFLRDRDGVRTPMQWSFDRNGGFSRADPARLYLPPVMDSVYGFEAVNVEAQSRSPSSLLNWMKRLIAARRSRRAFGRGALRFLYPSNRKVIAYLRVLDDEIILCVANLSRSPRRWSSTSPNSAGASRSNLLGRSVFPTVGELPYLLTLQAHSFFWFDLLPVAQEDAARAGGTARIPDVGDAARLVRPIPPAQSAAARERCDPRLSAAPALVRGEGPADQGGVGAGARRDRPAVRGRVGLGDLFGGGGRGATRRWRADSAIFCRWRRSGRRPRPSCGKD